MKTIWKFSLTVTDSQLILIPEGANILTAQMQNGTLCLWAEVDTRQRKEQRVIQVFGTGNPIQEPTNARRYISSVQDGNYVWHVFDAGKY